MTISVCEIVESVMVLYPPVALSEDRLRSNEASELAQASSHAIQLPRPLLVVVTDEITLDVTIEEGTVGFPKAMVGKNQLEFLAFLALWCCLIKT